jgi:hypothetical protein
MKNLTFLFISVLLISGCIPESPDLRDGRVMHDFRRIIAKDYPYIQVNEVINVEYGDGWDTGIETGVNFKGNCKSTYDRNNEICSSELLKLSISYSLDKSSEWQVIAANLAKK